jgi:IS5 family transposase
VSSMAEVGLVRFARIALEIAEAVLPDYRSKFSKHTFTQPQLLAILCLMRYEDWTLRKAEVRLAEHSELRDALGLHKAPDHTTLYRFLRRLDERTLVTALNESVRRLLPKPGYHEQKEPAATVAVDATGLAPGAISTFYVRRTRNRGGEPMLWRRWLKWLVVVDTDHQVVLAQEACSGPYNGSAMLRPLVDAAHEVTPLGLVLADAEFDSEQNHRHVRERLAAASVIPANRGKATWRVQGHRAKMRAAFPRQLYRRRALVESVFSAVKRKLSARAPGRSLETQRRQALLLGLAYNLYRLKPCPL